MEERSVDKSPAVFLQFKPESSAALFPIYLKIDVPGFGRIYSKGHCNEIYA